MYRSFSLLAVARDPERRGIAKIVRVLQNSYQFSNIRVTFKRTNREGKPDAQDCDLLLIGLETTLSSGSRALTLSSCPCVVWAPAWSRAAARILQRTGLRERTKLLLVGELKERAPQFPDGIRVLRSDTEQFEYKAACEIMSVLLEHSIHPDSPC